MVGNENHIGLDMSTSSGVGSQDGGEPNECNTKDGEKVNKIDFDRIV